MEAGVFSQKPLLILNNNGGLLLYEGCVCPMIEESYPRVFVPSLFPQDLCRRCLSYNKSCSQAWETMGLVMEKENSFR